MSAPVLVRGTTAKAGTIALAVLGAVGVFGGAAIGGLAARPVPGLLVLLVGLALGAAALIKHAVNVVGRVYLEIDAHGFRVRDRHGEVDYRDGDVTALAVDVEAVFANGTLSAARRLATLQIADNPDDVITMKYTFPLGQDTDPVGALFGRLQERLLARFRERVAAGGPVAGDGWWLDSQALFIETGAAQGRCPYADLAAVNIVDGHVAVWERGVAEAALRVPLRTLNAWALGPLLQERLSGDAVPEEDDRVAGGLGRIIFERNKNWSVALIVAVYLFAFGLAASGILLIGLGLFLQRAGLAAVGVGLIAVGGLVALLTYGNCINIFRAHALGVTRTTAFGTKDIRYEEVGTFTWSAMRMFVNGAYTGTTVKMTLEPLPGARAPAIRYALTHQGNDHELDNLRDFIAATIAGRWLTALQSGATVPWTGNSVFRQEGLDHRKGWFGGTQELIPYAKLLRWEVRPDGWLYVYGLEGKALVQKKVSEPNFFPGLGLLLAIIKHGGIPPRQEPTRRPSTEPARSAPATDEHIQWRAGTHDRTSTGIRRHED